MTSPILNGFNRQDFSHNDFFQQPWGNLSADAQLLMRDILSIDDQIRCLESQLDSLLGARRLFLGSLILNIHNCAGSAATAEMDSNNPETSLWQDLNII